METVRYPNVPSSLELMDSRQKAIYFGSEILHIFKSSDKLDFLRLSIFLIVCGILGNVFLILCVVGFRQLHKTAYLAEIFRSLVEMVLMVITVLLVNANMFTVDDDFSSPISMLIFIFLAGIYSSFQCMFKSIYIFLRLKKSKILKSVRHCSIICSLVVVSGATALAVLFLGIMYCSSILAFVIFSFLFYYGPFVVSWVLEILKFLHFNNRSKNYNVDSSSGLKAEYHKTDEDEVHVDENSKHIAMLPTNSPTQGMPTVGIFVAFITGVVRCIAFSIMTLVIVRITWAFFRRFTPVPVLESVPSIMEQLGS